MIKLVSGKASKIVEAYVQFERSDSAFQAFEAIRKGKTHPSNVLSIVPADTWHQPDIHSLWNTIDVQKSMFVNLYDDCLFEICQHLDLDNLVNLSQTCQRFHDFLHEFYFPKYKVYAVHFYRNSVNSLRRTMKCIGPYQVELTLDYRCYKSDDDTHCLETDHEQRATFKVLQHLGNRLEKLKVLSEGPLSNKTMQLLAPALRQITCLEWNAWLDCDTIQTFHQLCPRLEKLVMRKRLFTCRKNHNVTLEWPTLKSIEAKHFISCFDSACHQFFERLIQTNKQLQMLNLNNVNSNLFRILSENLEYFEIHQNNDMPVLDTEQSYGLLKSLAKLKVLVIRVKSTKALNEVPSQIKYLSQLKQLDAIVMVRNYSPSEWPFEYFPFAHFCSKISIKDNNIRLEIGNHSANIEYSTDTTTLVNIVNTINPNATWHRTIRQDVVTMFQSSKLFFPNERQSLIFENSECHQHIFVSTL